MITLLQLPGPDSQVNGVFGLQIQSSRSFTLGLIFRVGFEKMDQLIAQRQRLDYPAPNEMRHRTLGLDAVPLH